MYGFANCVIQNGNVIFWESLSTHSEKKARPYNKFAADPFARLRVPKIAKGFQVLFFISFLLLYYAVLLQRNPERITITEVFLYLWIVAYAYDEFGEFLDAGMKFYQTDFWSLWDLAIIGIGAAFLVTSECCPRMRPPRMDAYEFCANNIFPYRSHWLAERFRLYH